MPGEGDPVGEFANTCTEVHAIGYGFADNAFSPYPTPLKMIHEIADETQYYIIGAIAGKLALVIAGVLVGYLIFT